MKLRFVFTLPALTLIAASAPPGVPLAVPPSVTLSGTRTIVDRAGTGSPSTTIYAAVENDSALGSRTLTFGQPAVIPATGFQPVAQSIAAIVSFPYGTPVETSSIDAETRIDRGVHQQYRVDDIRVATITNEDQLAATEHVVEEGRGTNGTTFAHVDLVRTTNADGGFDERGSAASAEIHTLHVAGDFAATSHDQTPGFGLRDVTTSPPALDDPAATVNVTVRSQGRTIGNVPIVTKTYTVRRWFPSVAAPTVFTHVATPNAALPAECKPSIPIASVHVRDYRRQIDPTGSIRESVRDVYFDDSYAALCRIATDSTVFFDVTTGSEVRSHNEHTAVARQS